MPRWPASSRVALSPPDVSWPIWWLTFLSLTCLNLAIGLGPILLVGFLGAWTMYALAWPARSIDHMLRTLLPWAFPLLALASLLWSQAPMATTRHALQLLTVTGFGILMARAQPMRSFVSAFMCMMLTSVLAGTVLGRSVAIGLTNETALIGIFGSKNNFALMVSFMLLSAVAVLPDPRQPRILRLLALLCCVLAPPYMVLTKSVGAIITLGIALGTFGTFALASRLPARARPGLFLGAVLLGMGGFGLFLILESSGILAEMLRSFGKDTTLTGRTFLWQRAAQLIDLKPLLGVGYQAFWVQESVEAEGLWRLAKNTVRYGFHFHNLYYATAVELGYVGVAVLGVSLGTLAVTILVNAVRRPGFDLAFLASLVVIFFARAFIELDFIMPFTLGSLLIPILWHYGSRPLADARPLARP